MRVREVQVTLFVPPDRLHETVAFYKAPTGGRCTLHFPFPERGLALASVSSPAVSFLIVAGDVASLLPFRETKLSLATSIGRSDRNQSSKPVPTRADTITSRSPLNAGS